MAVAKKRLRRIQRKTCRLRDNGSNVHYSYWDCGGTGLPPLELVIQGEVR